MTAHPFPYSQPGKQLLALQAEWLAPARSRLLRRAAIAHRRSVLDLGAGFGSVTSELEERSSGLVVAFDLSPRSLHEVQHGCNLFRVAGGAENLPFASASFDLVYSQNTLLWTQELESVIVGVYRVLRDAGVLLALEPDYGGMIEAPPEMSTRDLWINALLRGGADPLVGRKLPALLASAGFNVRVDMLDRLFSPSPERFQLLRGLPLSGEELAQLELIESQSARLENWQEITHLPYFLISAEK